MRSLPITIVRAIIILCSDLNYNYKHTVLYHLQRIPVPANVLVCKMYMIYHNIGLVHFWGGAGIFAIDLIAMQLDLVNLFSVLSIV